MNDPGERVQAALRSARRVVCALRHEPCGRKFGDVIETGYGPLVRFKAQRKLTAAEMRELVPASQRDVWDRLAADPVALTQYAGGIGHLKVETSTFRLLDWVDSSGEWVAYCRKCNCDFVVGSDVLALRLGGSANSK